VSLFELAQGTVIKVKCRLCLAQVCDLCLICCSLWLPCP